MAWAELRLEYQLQLQADSSPVELNQWFADLLWTTPTADVQKLGNDPAFAGLEAAWRVATTGDTASIGAAENVDNLR